MIPQSLLENIEITDFSPSSSNSEKPRPGSLLDTLAATLRNGMAENHTQSSHQCFQYRPVILINYAFVAFKAIIVLPGAVVVLHLGYRRWCQRRFSDTTSHNDVLTYNMAVFDLIYIVGLLLFLSGEVSGLPHLMMVSSYVFTFSTPGPILLHVLTCLERYVAVIHPVTYLKLRHSSGTQIRNGFLVCIWLLGFGWSVSGPAAREPPYLPVFFLYAFTLVVVTLSSLRVLIVLSRPKPGEGGGANQSRLRAFQTMAVITGILWMGFVGTLVSIGLFIDPNHVVSCVLLVIGYWFTLPGHLVLPLLFLYRAGKFPGCNSAPKNNAN